MLLFAVQPLFFVGQIGHPSDVSYLSMIRTEQDRAVHIEQGRGQAKLLYHGLNFGPVGDGVDVGCWGSGLIKTSLIARR